MITYRQGKPEDLEAIFAVVQAAIVELNSHNIIQWDEIYPTKEDFENDLAKGELYLGEEDGRIAAFYVVNKECDPEYADCTWENPDDTTFIVHRFCVNPQFQHRGVGVQVLDHVFDQLRGWGAESVRLDAYTKNPFALKLYTKQGFVQRGYADWREGRFLIMEKKL